MTISRRILIRATTCCSLFLIVFAVASVAHPANATDVCGAVCDDTWTAAQSPYVASCDVTVAAGCSLTVEAGVQVLFDVATAIVVDGVLDVNGTAVSTVVFDSNLPTPAVGDWRGLLFVGTSIGHLAHAEVRHAERGIYLSDSAAVTLAQATSSWNSDGLYVDATAAPSVNASYCRFTNNYGSGVHVNADAPGADIEITRSEIHGNQGWWQVEAHGGHPDARNEVILARENWWGTTDPAQIAGSIYEHRRYHENPKVDWCAYLESAGGSPRNVYCMDLAVTAGETEVLDGTDSPYLLTSVLDVAAGGTLRMEAGVQVLAPALEDRVQILVAGAIETAGTAGSPVILTPEGVYGDPPYWLGLYVLGEQASASIEHTMVDTAMYGLLVGDRATATVHALTAESNRWGLRAISGGSITASGCTVTGNTYHGVNFSASSIAPTSLAITDSSIHSNLGDSDYYVEDLSGSQPDDVLVAHRNWWGTTDPGLIEQRILDATDGGAGARVDWCEWLDGPGGSFSPMHCPDPQICDEAAAWDQTDKPYVLSSSVQVCSTGSLTIGPGVEVRAMVADPKLDIEVYGALDVNGTQASPVSITSDSATPQSGDWSGLRVRGGGTADLDWAEITSAERGLHVFEHATANLNAVTSRANDEGLYVYGHNTVNATECTFTNNSRYGVYVRGVASQPDPSVTIHHSAIHSNAGLYQFFLDGGFSAPGETVFDAQYNWWGTSTATTIAGRVYDRADSSANVTVDWCKYLDSPGGTALEVNCVDLAICGETAVWDRTDKPYLITSAMEICPTGILHIESGVEVRVVPADTALSFRVWGLLDVNGTEASPVTITSDADTPQPLDWGGLTFEGNGRGELEYAAVLYGEYGVRALGAGSLDLTGVTLSQSAYEGLWVHGSGGVPSVHATGSSFTDNGRYGVFLRGHPNPDVTITDSSIHSNLGSFDLYTRYWVDPAHAILPMRNNWWGTTDADAIGSRIYDYRRNPDRPRVDYCGYLDAPGGVPYRDVHCPDLVICDETATWDLTDKPYQIVSDLWVCPTGTLTIADGVDVRTVVTDPEPDFVVEGVLDVGGSEAIGVTFDSDAPVTRPQDWPGLLLTTGSTSTIEHATISHAVDAVRAASDAVVTLDGVTLEASQTGLRVAGAGPPTVHATGCSFTNNEVYGIYLDGAPNPDVTITDSSIHSNLGSFDFYTYAYANPDEYVQLARNNWWGTTDADAIGTRIYGHRRSPSRPRIDFCGYLDGPGGEPFRDVHCPDLVACDETVVWDQTDRPYQIVTDLRVCPSGTLRIEAGVEARMVVTTPQPDFLVEGILDVNGTRISPVVLTSDAEAPQAQDWYGPVLTGSSDSEIEYADISYADDGIRVESFATADLIGVRARHNQVGLRVDGPGPPTVRASRCSFTHNDVYGVHLDGAPNPDVTVTASAIHSNLGSHDFYTYAYANPDTSVVWATDNWWGTTDEHEIALRIYDHEENGTRPHVYFQAFGESCDPAIGIDGDGDGLADFEDNCPALYNASQADADADGMGDPCDPASSVPAAGVCDGIGDVADGYLDSDGDGWGNPCDHRPMRPDSYPGAPELCDARDNDGDAALGVGETVDDDLDHGIACGDCDDTEPLAQVCACEACGNAIDDDCDLLTDGADGDCLAAETCIVLTAGIDPWMDIHKGVCGGAALSGPFDVIRGELGQVAFAGGSVDLGDVSCVEGGLDWDRVTDASPNPNPKCEAFPVLFYLGKNSADPDFGSASTGEPRDVTNPDPVCP